jgi:hypothetical protein
VLGLFSKKCTSKQKLPKRALLKLLKITFFKLKRTPTLNFMNFTATDNTGADPYGPLFMLKQNNHTSTLLSDKFYLPVSVCSSFAVSKAGPLRSLTQYVQRCGRLQSNWENPQQGVSHHHSELVVLEETMLDSVSLRLALVAPPEGILRLTHLGLNTKTRCSMMWEVDNRLKASTIRCINLDDKIGTVHFYSKFENEWTLN